MTTSGKSEHVSQKGPQKIIRSAKGSGGVLRVLTGGKKN